MNNIEKKRLKREKLKKSRTAWQQATDMRRLAISKRDFNECGECKACCIHLPIAAEETMITKPVGTPCKFLCEQGCSIHDKPDQPTMCKQYRCLWRRWEWMGRQPDLRPDKLGVIFGVFPDSKVVLFETKEGALDTAAVQRIRNRVALYVKKVVLREKKAMEGLSAGRSCGNGHGVCIKPDGTPFTKKDVIYSRFGKEVRVSKRMPLPMVA